ncbi:MAG: arginine--tRNA ligase [Lachnospiraceae bacterium oral taxon 082]|nr:arginine--tRNA ligase [Lachnospiraceae bacterium oral taxon 082]
MKTIIELISDELKSAFAKLYGDDNYGKVNISNRPDLCEYQCNGAMAAAKVFKKKPIDIANEVAELLKGSESFDKVEAVMPGFININISASFIEKYIKDMSNSEKYGVEPDNPSKKIMIDYGGANVAKPLHIGHLRSAIIGECLKRMGRFFGNEVISDVHLGDWGLQMGLIIEELRERNPELVYFKKDYDGEYPKESPFTLNDLEEIYPAASKKSKADENFKQRAQEATLELQKGYKPYRVIWQHIMDLSVEDLKKNYGSLLVDFDLWKGESDADPYIPDLIKDLEDRKIARVSEGALVVDIGVEGDKKELPPCIIRKSDGAALYATSDLGTLVEREKLYSPDEYIYIADKRQELHYTQFFRVARIAGIVPKSHELKYIGFGTINGKDGKPLKTRDGGVVRLEAVINDIADEVFAKIKQSRDISDEEARNTAKIVGLAAIKYADLSNQAAKDYIFDIDRFTSFEGNTGPYILYTIVRIKSILEKYYESGSQQVSLNDLTVPLEDIHKKLYMELSQYNEVMKTAWEELAPHRICQFIYSVSNTFNSFYHEIKILTESDEKKKKGYLATILLTKEILETAINLLGIEAPDKM